MWRRRFAFDIIYLISGENISTRFWFSHSDRGVVDRRRLSYGFVSKFVFDYDGGAPSRFPADSGDG